MWRIDRPSEAPLHPTMKPLALMELAIANSSPPGGSVLDPFLGSGSTLIACERMGRRCLSIELDPVHVGVALRRWERFSGLTAVQEGRQLRTRRSLPMKPADDGVEARIPACGEVVFAAETADAR